MQTFAMGLLVAAIAAALLCAACSSATIVAGRSLTDEERCVAGGGMWRVGQCQPCGGGMQPGAETSHGGASLQTRTTTDLAWLQAAQSQPLQAWEVLAPVYGFFTDGADTADVQEAHAALAGMDGQQLLTDC